MDLSIPKVLDLSLKLGNYNDNKNDIPQNPYNTEQIISESSGSINALESTEAIKEEPIEMSLEQSEAYLSNNTNNVEASCDQVEKDIPEVMSTNLEQVFNLSKSPGQHVKEEPPTENCDSSLKVENSSENIYNWGSSWNINQNVNQNQVLDLPISKQEQDIKPDIGNDYFNSYGQHQFQQFYGTFPQYQSFNHPTQLNHPNFTTSPNMSQNGFPPNYNFGAQSNQFQNTSMWNGYSYPWNQFQYGSQANDQYMQQSSHLENQVKLEINVSDENTSDLGSSFNSSDDSFNSNGDHSETKATFDNRFNEDILWVPDEQLLPKGWKKRIYKSGKTPTHNFYISPTNEKFKSKSALVDHMERNPGLFSQHDIEKLKPKDLYDWIQDETLLPRGWKKRVNKNGEQRNYNHFFLSPTNEKFTSKSSLLEHMERNPTLFTQNDIYKFKCSMQKDSQRNIYDWIPDETLLPQGWKMRVNKDGDHRNYHFFLSPNNEKFTSKSALLDHMERNLTLFTQNDIYKFKCSMQKDPQRNTYDWIPDETLLPQGWKMRVNKDGDQRNYYFFLSPTNEKFTSKSALLEHMERNPTLFTQNDIYKFRCGMQYEPQTDLYDWVPDETLLPIGWKKRVNKNGELSHYHFFLSPTNDKFKSKIALLEHMERNPTLFTQNDVSKFKRSMQKVPQKIPQTDPFDWAPDETLLPKGWKKRVNKNGTPHQHHFFLSPTNQRFDTKTKLIEYMEQNPNLFTQNDIYKLKSTMTKGKQRQYTNWDSSDPTLPPGWFKRYCDSVYSGKPHRDYQYLSPKREIFLSRNAVVAYMKENSYATEDIQLFFSGKLTNGRNIKIGADKFIRTTVRNYTDWDNSDETLPKGWLKRHSFYNDSNGGKHIEYQYLSPNQIKFTSRNAVAAFMEKSGQYSQEDIRLVHSGRGRR